jgi:hypothetical protein
MNRFLCAPCGVLLLLGLVPLLLVTACPKEEDHARRLTITKVEVFDRTPPPDRVAGLTEEKVRGWVTRKLEAASALKLADQPGKKDGYQLKVELGVGRKQEGWALLIAARAAAPDDLEGIALQANAVRSVNAKPELGQMRHAVETAMADIAYQARLVVGDEAALVRALAQEKEAARLAAAVEIAAVRRVKRTVPALIKLLTHRDARVADRAIGALVAIGDRRAVKPLTRLSKFSDTEKMAKLIDGIGSLGGSEAKEFLEFVESGHEDADIRNLAAEALERMKRRDQAKNQENKGNK